MLWLIFHMWFWLLAALVLGWLLRSWLSGDAKTSSDDAAELARSRSRIQTLEAENSRFKGDIVRLRDEMGHKGDDDGALAALRADLDACTRKRGELEAEIARLKADMARNAGIAADFEEDAAALRARIRELEAELDAKPAASAAIEGVTFLSAPIEGTPDDLKKIKGIGPKLEETLHQMGVYYYRQIASWGASNLAELDDRLDSFKGRAGRDNWIDQAKTLASGGQTEFGARYDKGENNYE